MNVDLDRWDANRCLEETVEANTSAEVMEIVRRLDGDRHTLMSIVREDDTIMIGGGPDLFVVVVQYRDGSSMCLSNGMSEQAGKEISLCIGGQPGNYEARIVIDRVLVESLISNIVERRVDEGKLWIHDEPS